MVKGVNEKRELSSGRSRTFLVFGRELPSEKQPEPKVIAVRVLAPNAAVARSRFWKLNKREHKLKKSHGQLLGVQEVFPKNSTVPKNFGIFLKYQSHTGIQNMHKEFRDISLNGAIDQLYNEMGGNYGVSSERVSVIRCSELSTQQLSIRNPRCRQWSNPQTLKYAHWNRRCRATNPAFSKTFQHNRPVTTKTDKSILL